MRTAIWILIGTLTVNSFAAGADDAAKRLEKVFHEMRVEGIRTLTSNDIVFIDGTVQVPGYLTRVEQVVSAFRLESPKLVFQSLVKVDPQAWERLAERVEREIGSPEITARVLGKSAWLEGIAESDFEADRAVEVAKTHFRSAAHDRAMASIDSSQPVDNFEIVDLIRVRRPGKSLTKASSKKAMHALRP